MRLNSTLYFLMFLISFGVFAQSVNIDGDPYGGNPYPTIEAAITAADDGDVILISGIHTETLSFDKSITLRGTDPTTDIIQAAASPASDGTGSQVISIFADPAVPANITIENLGIRHGNQGGINGGGIDIDKVTGLITLRNLIIEDNFTNELGGGLAIAGSNADIIECTIRNNESVKAGGGLIVAPNNGSNQDSTINIRQSLIDNNQGANGGGLYINGNPNFGDDYRIFVDIENSTISNNFADSGGGAVGGGSIWSKASTWTTNDGGDGTSTNVYLTLVHSTLYNNSHASANKNGIRATGNDETDFSAYNSIIVNADVVSNRAVNFLNINTIDVVNCILGGLQNLQSDDINILDDTNKNNVRGKTATFAGLSGTLSDEGGNTQVITVSENSNSDDYCTATVTGVTLPTIDQTGYTRTGTSDAGAFEVRCDAPTGVANINLASTAASFSWSANPSAGSGYEYAVVLSGDDPDIPGDVVASASLASGVTQTGITGLSIDTDYDFYIRSECGSAEFSGWSAALPFTTAFQGNLFLNSRFTDLNGDPSLDIENDGTPEWSGYGTGAELDNIIGENIGFISNTEGLLRQDFDVIPGVTYAISFNYRWVSGTSSGDTNPPRTPVIRNDIDDALIQTLPAVQTVSDTWYTYTYLYTHPTSGLTTPTNRVRFQIFKADDNNQLNFYNITVLEDRDFSADYDFVYQNGSWSPGAPSTATSTDDVYVYNGLVDITNNVSANNVEVSPWADVNVESVLSIANDLTIQPDGVLTFKSDASESGQLDDATGLNISGDVTVERFIASKRAFRLLSSPVTSTDFIYENWQESGSTPLTEDNLGTHITGGSASDGFDQSGTNNPSMFTFDNANQNWEPIDNTNATKLMAGEAYLTMVRGDRTIDLMINSNNNIETTLRATGDLFTGPSSPVLSTGLGFYSLIANPYQAVVDYSLATRTDLTDFIYVWDASIGGTNGRGGYVTVEVSSNSITDPDPTSSDATKFIAPGMSFFVQNLSSGTIVPDLTFNEDDKATGENQVTVFDTYPYFYINSRLYLSSDLQNGSSERDAVGLRFSENFTTAGSDEDATKLGNPDENYAIVNNGLRSIDKQALPTLGYEIDLSITNYTANNYSLTFVIENKPENLGVFLKDKYLNSQTEINQSFVYDFTIDTSIPESMAENRFSLVFDNTTLGLDDNLLKDDFSIYPNPTDGDFTVKTPELSGNATIQITNMLGQVVKTQTLNIENQKAKVSAENLSRGVYIVELIQDSKSNSVKLVIE